MKKISLRTVLLVLALTFPIVAFSAAAITGQAVSADTGSPVTDGIVVVYDSQGRYLGLDSIDNAGFFSYPGLGPGTYFVRTEDTGLLDELWQDIPCPQGQCNPAAGTPVVISGTETASLNFSLGTAATISGTAVSAATGSAVTDGVVVIYDSQGRYLGLDSIDNAGAFSYPGLGPGTYFVRTEDTGLLDELWQDIPCPQGQCNPATGTPVVISGTETTTLNFLLGEGDSDAIFKDSFEQ